MRLTISVLFVLLATIVYSQSKKVNKFIEEYELVAHHNPDGHLRNILRWEGHDTLS